MNALLRLASRRLRITNRGAAPYFPGFGVVPAVGDLKLPGDKEYRPARISSWRERPRRECPSSFSGAVIGVASPSRKLTQTDQGSLGMRGLPPSYPPPTGSPVHAAANAGSM